MNASLKAVVLVLVPLAAVGALLAATRADDPPGVAPGPAARAAPAETRELGEPSPPKRHDASEGAAGTPSPTVLRVCSDPNNLPFSNAQEQGFENRIAEIVARALKREVEYVWRPQRRGFLREGINAGACDVVMALPATADMALVTEPYYRSSYVFVRRAGASARIGSFDDPRLRDLRIGVQLIGDDYANSPPAHALARRGLARNLVGYTVYGDYREDSPPADVVRAVARGEVDVSVVWGPLAGYFGKRSGVRLEHGPVEGQSPADPPMRFAISMAVKRGNVELKMNLDAILVQEKTAIDRILSEFGVPRV